MQSENYGFEIDNSLPIQALQHKHSYLARDGHIQLQTACMLAVIVGCISGSLICVYYAQGPTATAPKRLVAEQAHIHLGTIDQQVIETARFVLRNESPHTVYIDDIKPSCTCTSANVEKSELKPGEITYLHVSLNSSSYRGEMHSLVVVNYRNDQHGQSIPIHLTASADVTPEYSVEPSGLIFHASQSARQIVTLQSTASKQFELVRVYSSHPAFTAELENKNSHPNDSRTFTASVTFDPKLWVDNHSGQPKIIFHTNSQKEPVHHFSVRVHGE